MTGAGPETTATQFDNATSGRPVDIVVGLDFGTAFTKVVIRSPWEFGNRAYAVPLSGARSSGRYLLPSQIRVHDDRGVAIEGEGGRLCTNIKWRLLSAEGAERAQAEWEAVAFVASVLRFVRRWFLRSQRSGYGGFTLRWTLQIGVPSETFGDLDRQAVFGRVGRAGWLLSVTPGRVTLERACESIECLEEDVGRDDARLSDFAVIPEVAAEVVGYARSDLRTSGLHFLVDAGASTLDVAGFILHENEEGDLYPILSASVRMNGSLALQRARCDAVAAAAADPLLPLPRGFRQWMARDEGLKAILKATDADFVQACRVQIGEVLREVHARRDPHAAAWKNGVPVFLCGGGRSADFVYQRALDLLDASLRKGRDGWPGFRILRLDAPRGGRLVAPELDPEQYHRLAVAWGLSIPRDDIGTVIRPPDIPDVSPSLRVASTRAYIDKDQV